MFKLPCWRREDAHTNKHNRLIDKNISKIFIEICSSFLVGRMEDAHTNTDEDRSGIQIPVQLKRD